jgi:hypothetical protein
MAEKTDVKTLKGFFSAKNVVRKWLCSYDISKQYFPKFVAVYSDFLFLDCPN